MNISSITFLVILCIVSFLTYVVCSYTLDCDIKCKINYKKIENRKENILNYKTNDVRHHNDQFNFDQSKKTKHKHKKKEKEQPLQNSHLSSKDYLHQLLWQV